MFITFYHRGEYRNLDAGYGSRFHEPLTYGLTNLTD